MSPSRNPGRPFFRRTVFPFGLFALAMGMAGLIMGSVPIVMFAACTAAFSALVAARLTRQVRDSLGRVQRRIMDLAEGRPAMPIREAPFDEFAAVASAINDLSAVLVQQRKWVQERQEREETILSSMREALIAVDRFERVIRANQAAEPLMRMPLDQVVGRSAQEAFRYAGLHRLFHKLVTGGGALEEEIELHDPEERVLQAQGATLRDADGAAQGAVVVLHDITPLRRLERVRKEFVANVSHELKTPATSIRGFVETLRDGAMDDPAQARRFLDIVQRQSERLQTIIDDLLVLSRLEEQVDRRHFVLEATPIRPLIESAVHLSALRTEKIDVPIRIECPEELVGRINPPLVEQAVMNLVDNALKYGASDSQVVVHAETENGAMVIRVRDQGPGISREHLPRIFERFYRVDKARSRARGGTGLGLAIVKHIAQAHGGTAEVWSRPGEGSEFRLVLPLDSNAERSG